MQRCMPLLALGARALLSSLLHSMDEAAPGEKLLSCAARFGALYKTVSENSVRPLFCCSLNDSDSSHQAHSRYCSLLLSTTSRARLSCASTQLHTRCSTPWRLDYTHCWWPAPRGSCSSSTSTWAQDSAAYGQACLRNCATSTRVRSTLAEFNPHQQPRGVAFAGRGRGSPGTAESVKVAVHCIHCVHLAGGL